MSQEHDRTVTAVRTDSKPAPVAHGTPVVFVVDEDASVRESLETLIRCAGWHPETFARAHEFLARTRVAVPGCLVLDVTLPDLDGLAVQKRIAGDRTELPIIFITGRGDVSMAVRAMKAGAVEFLQKPLGDDVVLNAMREAIDRSHTALEQQAEVRALRDRYAALSPRERAVLTLVVSGRLNKQVGAELGISEITVKAHRGSVMRKMQADSLADLVRMAATLDIPLVARAPDRTSSDRCRHRPIPSSDGFWPTAVMHSA